MMNDNGKKKGINWFKSNIFNQTSTGDKIEGQEEYLYEEKTIDMEENQKEEINQQSNNIFAKDNQDKIVLDLIVPLENIIKDRQLLVYKNKGLEEQLNIANQTINRINQDLIKKEQVIQKKNKEITDLETNLTNKQMSYDQLLEDYMEYQNTSNTEYEMISNQLNAEINKYNKFNEETMNTQYQNMLKINELEEKIRSLEIENQQYIEKHQKIYDEKAELIKTINNFTKQMSFSFSPKEESSTELSE